MPPWLMKLPLVTTDWRPTTEVLSAAPRCCCGVNDEIERRRVDARWRARRRSSGSRGFSRSTWMPRLFSSAIRTASSIDSGVPLATDAGCVPGDWRPPAWAGGWRLSLRRLSESGQRHAGSEQEATAPATAARAIEARICWYKRITVLSRVVGSDRLSGGNIAKTAAGPMLDGRDRHTVRIGVLNSDAHAHPAHARRSSLSLLSRRPRALLRARIAASAARGRRDSSRSPSTASCAAPTWSAIRPTACAGPADSQKLYFDWRKPGEEEASTYVVGRDGGTPREADGRAEEERAARQRPLGQGAQARPLRRPRRHRDARRRAARAAGSRARPAARATRAGRSNDTAVTYVRDGNLFIVPLDDAAACSSSPTSAPKKADPRLTDSQKFIREEEEKLLDAVKEQKDRKKKADEKDKQDKLPALELQDRQTALDLMLSPDDTHVFVLVAERPAGARNVIVPELRQRDRLHRRHPRPHRRRRRAEPRAARHAESEDRQDRVGRRQLRAARRRAGRDPPRRADEPRPPQAPGKKAEREIRWSMPDVVRRRQARGRAARDRPTTRTAGTSPSIADTGKTRVVDTLHDDAWIREAGGGFGIVGRRVPARQQARVVPVRARRLDAPLHARRRPIRRAKAKQLTSGKWEITSASLVARRQEVLHHQHRGASGRASSLHDAASTAARAPRSPR